MSLPIDVAPTSKLLERWKQVTKRIDVELGVHKAPAVYAEASSMLVVYYAMMSLAIFGDIYLAVSVLAKAGVNLAFVIGSVFLDFALAVAPLVLARNFKAFDVVENKNRRLYYELDAQLTKRGESEPHREQRHRHAKDQVLPRLDWLVLAGKFFVVLIAVLVLLIAYWKIFTYQSTKPFPIWPTMSGKLVVTVSSLVALFHLVATEKAVAGLMFTWTKARLLAIRARLGDAGNAKWSDPMPIEYEGQFNEATSGGTRIENINGIPNVRYLHLIRDEEINQLRLSNPQVEKAVLAACKKVQLGL